MRVVERQSTDVVSVSDERVATALRFIREHVTEGIDVSDVLRAVPMSRTLLERKFKAALGHSPHRQIMHQRIERAKHLLIESEVSIAVVAELAGFADASYLSVAFRRETGESPYAYRTRHRTDIRELGRRQRERTGAMIGRIATDRRSACLCSALRRADASPGGGRGS